MNDFVSRWTEWETVEKAKQATDKTDESRKLQADMPKQRTDRTDESPSVSSVSRKPDLTAPDHDEVASMTLTAFAQAGLIVIVHSEVFGAEVLFASDNVAEDALVDYDMPIYRAEELKKLARLGPGPRELLRLHIVKDIFQGSITGVEEMGDV